MRIPKIFCCQYEYDEDGVNFSNKVTMKRCIVLSIWGAVVILIGKSFESFISTYSDLYFIT